MNKMLRKLYPCEFKQNQASAIYMLVKFRIDPPYLTEFDSERKDVKKSSILVCAHARTCTGACMDADDHIQHKPNNRRNGDSDTNSEEQFANNSTTYFLKLWAGTTCKHRVKQIKSIGYTHLSKHQSRSISISFSC